MANKFSENPYASKVLYIYCIVTTVKNYFDKNEQRQLKDEKSTTTDEARHVYLLFTPVKDYFITRRAEYLRC